MNTLIARASCAALLAGLACAPAAAAPYSLSFLGTVTTDGGVAGVAVGDTVSINVVVDNGGSSTLSQTWAVAETVSASLSVGSYFANFTDDFFPSGLGFETNAAGDLVAADWYGTDDSATSTDSFAGSNIVRLFNGAVQTSLGSIFFFTPGFGSASSWTGPVAVAAVPVPSAALLALAGLGALVATRRRAVAAA